MVITILPEKSGVADAPCTTAGPFPIVPVKLPPAPFSAPPRPLVKAASKSSSMVPSAIGDSRMSALGSSSKISAKKGKNRQSLI